MAINKVLLLSLSSGSPGNALSVQSCVRQQTQLSWSKKVELTHDPQWGRS